ncbi:MAG: AMP-binding protein [Euryarchaeota archaeon]|nr:AMP-binding protein [Euryarchaeota archaeon]
MLEGSEDYHDLPSLLRGKARKNGEKVAIRFPGHELSYADLLRQAERAAGGLAERGLRHGEKIAFLLYNAPEFLTTWYGANLLGAVMVPLNTALKGELLRYELEDCDARFLLVDRRLHEEFAKVAGSVKLDRVIVFDPAGEYAELPAGTEAFPDLLTARGVPSEAVPPTPVEPASIMYTSGTTGPPKGVVIPHEKYLSTAKAISGRSDLNPSSVLFSELPLFHCNAQEMTMHTALLNDLTAAYAEWFKASNYWEVARELHATHVSLLIAMINILYKQPEKPSDREHGVRVALTAGTSKDIWPLFEQRFGLRVIELYGMTECGCTTIMNPPDHVRVGSVGLPLDFVEAEVVDENDRPVPPRTKGELLVRPKRPFTMMLEYYKKPEKTVEAWRNLWFHTGDYVWKDEDGYFYFVERKKDVIRRRGENIAPYDVEKALNTHPAVFESVVVGVPSPLGEEDVKAYVLLKPGANVDPAELFRHTAAALPFFMVPQFIEFVDEIPKTANQKAQRYLLRSHPHGPRNYDRDKLGVQVARPAR